MLEYAKQYGLKTICIADHFWDTTVLKHDLTSVIAKECGCKFYCDSDAHHPKDLDAAKSFHERAIDYLELTEDDKFILK